MPWYAVPSSTAAAAAAAASLFPQIEPLSVVVFGAGPVGLVIMATARAMGARRIIAVDIVPSRLEFAKAYAATDVFLPVPMTAGEDKLAYAARNAQAMRAQLGIEERGPRSIDLVVEASGAEASVRTGMFIARIGGRYVQVRPPRPRALGPSRIALTPVHARRSAWARPT